MTDLTHTVLLGASVQEREVWDQFDASGEAEKCPEDMQPIADYVRGYYGNDKTATAVDPVLMRVALVDTIKDPKRKAMMAAMIDAVYKEGDTSIENARAACIALRSKRVGESLATKLLIPSKDGKDEVLKLIDEYLGTMDTDPESEAPQWSKEYIAPQIGEPRIPVYPRMIGNKLRGGLWPGHHMIVFARPEIGKTAFVLNLAVRAAANGAANVLYLSNEDTLRDLLLRSLVLFNQQGMDDVIKNLDESIHTARRRGADRLRFKDMAPGNLAEVDRLVRRHKPDLLIVDQLRNMGVGKVENMTQRLDAAAQGIRNIAKRHNVAAISVTQAGDSARDKAILDDGDVDNSNTGISAGCDVLIGVGATPVMREAGERRFTFIKNKLGGWHGNVDVRLDPLTLQFRDNV